MSWGLVRVQVLHFAVSTLSDLFHFPPRYLNLLLPVGISFYTFQTLSYVVDVYRDDVPAEKHFGKYATFVSFFPQLVAGPIERSASLLPQIHKKHEIDLENMYYGIRLIVWGLFKKMVVADNLAVFVDQVYGDIYNFSGGPILIATVFFSVQIYCDFLGIFRYCKGLRQTVRNRINGELQEPVFCNQRQGFLGTMAYFPFQLVQGLSIYSTGRQQGRQIQKLHQCHGYISGERTLARRKLELCYLGWDPRSGAGI